MVFSFYAVTSIVLNLDDKEFEAKEEAKKMGQAKNVGDVNN